MPALSADRQAAEKAGEAGQLAEKLAKAIEISFGKSRAYRFVAKSGRPGNTPATHSLSLHFQLYESNWVLTHQVIESALAR